VKISMHTMAADSFAPMLESLSHCLDAGAAYAASSGVDLLNARLAPDMYTLAQQVQQATHYVHDGMARLTGSDASARQAVGTSLQELKQQIRDAIALAKNTPAEAFAGADERDCSIPIPNGMQIELDGLRFLRAWTLPHFYFHVVTAYDILRHVGVPIGKNDYLSQVGAFIKPQRA
jgi:hypothetical protein